MLGDTQRRKLDHLFHLVDVDDSGFIEFSDLETIFQDAMRRANRPPEHPLYQGGEVMLRRFWDAFASIADTNADAKISQVEWFTCWEGQLAGLDDPMFDDLPPLVRWIHLLVAQAAGVNDAGGADLETYRRFLAPFGDDVADGAEAAFPSLDLDGNGVIDADELQQLTAEFFVSDASDSAGNALFGRLD